jgi:hypothetical protein
MKDKTTANLGNVFPMLSRKAKPQGLVAEVTDSIRLRLSSVRTKTYLLYLSGFGYSSKSSPIALISDWEQAIYRQIHQNIRKLVGPRFPRSKSNPH